MLVRRRTAHFLSLGEMVHRNTGKSMNANQIRKIEEGYLGDPITHNGCRLCPIPVSKYRT